KAKQRGEKHPAKNCGEVEVENLLRQSAGRELCRRGHEEDVENEVSEHERGERQQGVEHPGLPCHGRTLAVLAPGFNRASTDVVSDRAVQKAVAGNEGNPERGLGRTRTRFRQDQRRTHAKSRRVMLLSYNWLRELLPAL